MTYDVRIGDALIVDGTGAPAYRGDIGIAHGRIAALGRAPGDARETIDAGGLVAAPGFIDMHTHYDVQVMWDSTLAISPWHGVTTAVMGNCGFGIAPARPAHRDMILRTLERVEAMSLAALRTGLGDDWGFETFPEYLDAVEARGSLINVGCYLGHTPLRLYVMGADAVRREATDAELASMCGLVREGMEAGALGFSTTRFTGHNGFDGEPVPSRLASFAEFDALIGAMAESGHGIMQATAGDLLLEGLEDLARAHGITITWSALLSGMRGPGSHRDFLERTRHLIEDEGLNIIPQTSPRPLCIDFTFDEPFPFERQALFVQTMKTGREGRKALYRDPAFRARLP
jgi:N-acyl-D-amino-acid deacylase